MQAHFEWDAGKAASNQEKHGVTFREATTAFADPLAMIFDDVMHSSSENREILIGHSEQGVLVLVSFVERPPAIRIISARRATAKEQRDYENGTGYR